MEALGFRVGVDLTQIISGIKSKSFIFIDLSRDNTISDIERRIRDLFGIEYRVSLITDNYFLPSSESVRLLRDGDVVRVVNSHIYDNSEEHKSKAEHSRSSPTTTSSEYAKLLHKSKKRYHILNDERTEVLLQEDESKKCNILERHSTPVKTTDCENTPVFHTTKRKWHISNDAELSENKTKKCKRKKKHAVIGTTDTILANTEVPIEHHELDDAPSEVKASCGDNAVTALKKLYTKCFVSPVSKEADMKDETVIENKTESSLSSSKLANTSSVGSTYTTGEITSNSFEVNQKRSRKRRKRTHKKHSPELNRTEVDTSPKSYQYTRSTTNEPAQGKHIRFLAGDTDNGINGGASSCLVNDDTEVNINASNSGNVDLKLESSHLLNTPNASDTKSKWDEKTVLENNLVNAVIKNIYSPKVPINEVFENVLFTKPYQTTPLVFESKKTELTAHNGDISDRKCTIKSSTNKTLDLSAFNPDAYPILSGTPRKNDLLAFKMLKMDIDYTPQMSGFILAKVLNFCLQTSEVNLEIIDGLHEFKEPKGKFHLADDDTNGDDDNDNDFNIKISNMQLNWNELLETRLLYP